MTAKTMALSATKSTQIRKLLGDWLSAKEIMAKGFNPGLVYSVKSKNSVPKKAAPSLTAVVKLYRGTTEVATLSTAASDLSRVVGALNGLAT